MRKCCVSSFTQKEELVRSTSSQEERTEILHEDPPPIPDPIPLILEAVEAGMLIAVEDDGGATVADDIDEVMLMSMTLHSEFNDS